MIKAILLIILCIVGFAVVIHVTVKGSNTKFYELPWHTLLWIVSIITMFAAAVTMWRGIDTALEIGDEILSDINFFGFFMMLLIGLPLLIVISLNYNPLHELIENYKYTKKGATKIPYSIFKKMYALHPEKFFLDDICFKYGTHNIYLIFFSYLRVLHILSAEKARKTKRNINRVQQDIYDEMRRDLDADLDTISRQREQAHKNIYGATMQTQRILDRMKNGTV